MARRSQRPHDGPILPRQDDSDEQFSEDDVSGDEGADESPVGEDEDESGSVSDMNMGDGQDQESADDTSGIQSLDEDAGSLHDISFGALAKAQASLGPPTRSRKPQLSTTESYTYTEASTRASDNSRPSLENKNQKSKQELTSRTSKHAPTVMSSRKPVSRKRSIISPPPVAKSRDPRFDPTITSRTLNSNAVAQAAKAYSFLTTYQADEILALKAQIKKTQNTDPMQADQLKKKLMSMESRLRNAETQSKEREIRQRHKAQEKQAIREGKKSRPYFLKKSEVRKEIEQARVEGMGKKQKDKLEKRRRMREKRKEARDMPWARRMG